MGSSPLSIGGEFLPLCVICVKTLSNAAVKPSFFKRHLVTNQVKEKELDENYFQRLRENAKRQRLE